MRHSTSKNAGMLGKLVSVVLALLIVVSIVVVAFTATKAPVVSAAAGDRIKVGNLADSAKAHWVEATYFDYLSDTELTNSNNGSKWLEPNRAGTGHNGSDDDWYPFTKFNNYISSSAARGTYPLYFGNFCYTTGAYNTDDHNGPYIAKARNLNGFSYIANNSNAIKTWTGNGYNFGYSVQNLAKDKLVGGNIQATGANGTMPYFDETKLGNYAKIFKSYFPFRQENIGTGLEEVKKYTFDSNIKDNVFFNWTSAKTIGSVNYGQGINYAVQDGLKDFMGNEGPGYGIFPFNNKDSATAGTRGGNSNLDYGFGIKMDFDFKVPAGGKYSDGTAAEFTYSGDDDLWVYMAEYKDNGTLGDSHLVLDLGGNHKMSSGNINFATMQSTANQVVDITKNNYSSDTIYIADDFEWGFIDGSHTIKKKNSGNQNLRIWAWADGQVAQWYYPQWDDNLKMFKISKSDKGSNQCELRWMNEFLVTEATDEETIDNTRQTSNLPLNNYYGKVLHTSDPSYSSAYESPKYGSETKSLADPNFGFTTVSAAQRSSSASKKAPAATGAAKTLDPNKKYHMTIYYMERGMIESNNSMGFTLTPADNELKVTKNVNTNDVNSTELQNDIKNNEKFTFTASAAGETSYSDTIKHGGTADFSSKYKTGTSVSVTESEANALEYTTTYVVKDNINSTSTAPATGTKADFMLEDTQTHDADDDADILVTFTNTPKLAPVTVSKKILERVPGTSNAYQTAADAKDTFTYTMYVNIKGTNDASDFKKYNLDYIVSGENSPNQMSNGEFSFSSDKTVTIPNLPIGATYKLVESSKTGYEAVQDTITGKVGTNGTAAFENKQVPVNTNIKAKKTLDGQAYTGSLFNFTLEGLESIGGSEDVHTQSKTVSNVDGGEIAFNSDSESGFLTFPKAGTYRYKLSEKALTGAYKNDITTDSKIYLVNIVVAPDGDKLKATTTYKETTKTSGYTASDFAGGTTTAPTFSNTVKKGSATVVKQNQAKDKTVDNTTFTLYKVESGTDNSLTEAKKVSTLTTGKNGQTAGQVKFDNLDIYESGYTSSSALKYQWYCIVEEKSATGYSLNNTKVYFQLPKADENGVMKYDFRFEYQNGKIFAPTTAGDGVEAFKVVGLAVTAFAILLLAAYLFESRRFKSKRFAQ